MPDPSQPADAIGGIVADKLVVWNCNNHRTGAQGMLSCNVELRRARKVVWSKQGIPLAWSKDEEPATTVPLPKIAFDALRVETVTFHDWGPALCEVEVFRGSTNLAKGKSVTASGFHDADYPPTAVVDGITNSAREFFGYWIAPDRQHAWVEVQIAPPAASLAKIVYLADLPALETKIYPGTFLLQSHAVGKDTAPHCLFLHAIPNSSSHVAFMLDRKHQTLVGAAAISDTAGDGSLTPLTFRIVGDGKELWRATLQKAGAKQPLDIAVGRVKRLELFVDCPGAADFAQSMWFDMELTPVGAAPLAKAAKTP